MNLVTLLTPLTIAGVLVFLVLYVLFFPDKAQTVAGWLWRGIGAIYHKADKRAVAYLVQGAVNSATTNVMESTPPYLLEGKLHVKWTNAQQAEAVLHNGEVVVFLRKSEHQHENVARALMAYIPKAVIPRARRYVDAGTMKAADLILAKSILCQDGVDCGALDAFYNEFMDSARESPQLRSRIEQIDEIDVQGWLERVLLAEYYAMANKLYPAEPRTEWLQEAELFADWLHGLAAHAPGQKGSLDYRGRLISIGVIFVADKLRLLQQGIEPYRWRAKRLVYVDQVDAVYLMARDDNISAVRDIADSLRSDALIDTCGVYEYHLRSDFAARKAIARDRAICVCLRRRLRPAESSVSLRDISDDADLPHETFDITTGGSEPVDHQVVQPTQAP
jgi:hypothetical protein